MYEFNYEQVEAHYTVGALLNGGVLFGYGVIVKTDGGGVTILTDFGTFLNVTKQGLFSEKVYPKHLIEQFGEVYEIACLEDVGERFKIQKQKLEEAEVVLKELGLL